jgi:hypothetical protein
MNKNTIILKVTKNFSVIQIAIKQLQHLTRILYYEAKEPEMGNWQS